MPRPLRQSIGGMPYHVLNRANGGSTVFASEADYQDFLELLAAACERRPVGLLAWCLMPTHFHLVVETDADGDLSLWMQWLATAHVRRYHRRHQSVGHLWQGRYRSFPIQADGHVVPVLRYVERNPLRAGLVARAEEWPWSSLSWAVPSELARWRREPAAGRPAEWVARVNAAENAEELAAVRLAVVRGRPFGEPAWQAEVARRLGLECSLRPRGRPRKGPET